MYSCNLWKSTLLILALLLACQNASPQIRRMFRLLRRNSDNELSNTSLSEADDQGATDVLTTSLRFRDSSCRNQSHTDVHLKTPELIRKKGFPFEAHQVTSEGYILKLHRIPGRPGSKPVLLVHGMTQSSRDFLLNCERKALGYKLSDAGFDVWLANVRGNEYSDKHKNLSRDDAAFWNFTVDDLTKYDSPAMVDYILNTTGEPKLVWIGYSLGTAMALGFLSTQPEYNQKVELFVGLGTVAYAGQTSGFIIRSLARYQKTWETFLKMTNKGRLLPERLIPIVRRVIPAICFPEAVLDIPLYCQLVLGLVFRLNYFQANPRIISVLGSGTPNQWSVRVFAQWFQWIQSGEFSFYDYGREGNLKQYGFPIPPVYDLKKVTTKVANFWSKNDNVAVPEDIEKLISELPNVVSNIQVPVRGWTHIDYLYGRDADKYVYNQIIKVINKFT